MAVGLLVLCTISSAQAQLAWTVSLDGTNGSAPLGNLTLSGDGDTLYGTTEEGGAGAGTVFSIPVTGGTPTTLVSFNETDGAYPAAGVTLSGDGNTLYGTTGRGGANDDGTVFSVPVTGGTPTTLVTFNGTNGYGPYGSSLTLSGTTLYGTTQGDGINNVGTVFSVSVTGGTPTTLATFTTTGANPSAGLTLSGTTLYGTVPNGGSGGYGAVFSVPVTGGTPTTLAAFNGTNGNGPFSGLTLIGSTLYGTTWLGGANNDGTIFSVPVTGGTPTTLATFNGANGAEPFIAELTLSGTTLYGTTEIGGAYGDGTVFSLSLTTGTLTTLFSFDGTDGKNPFSGLTLDGNILYGTTNAGGANGDGTIFALDLQAVPEPATWVLLLMSMSGCGLLICRPRRKA